MQVTTGVHHFASHPFNWYIVEQSGRLTVFDAGFPGHLPILEQGIHSLGFALKDVEAIVLTHAHADHIGFAHRLSRLSNAPIYLHPLDAPAARRPLQLPWPALLSNSWRPFMANVLFQATLNGVFTMAHVPHSNPISDGQTLDVPGRPFVIHTPGHTPGHCAFYLPQHKVLISGDALITRDLYTGELTAPQLARPALNSDDVLAHQSLKRLITLGSVHLLPGHGPAWFGDLSGAASNLIPD